MEIQLTGQQLSAVDMVKNNKVSLLVGGPGTGKTTVTKEVIRWAHDSKLSVSLAAPSGKAAKRIIEATGHYASTIHKVLEAQMTNGNFSFARNQDNPIETDLLIIDETSMVSNDLAADLLRAVKDDTKILFVGDQDQLPSVAAGAILRDMLASKKIPHTELNIIHRNSGDIVRACHAVKNGKNYVPSATLDLEAGLNLRHIEIRSEAKILETIQKLVAERLPARGFDPVWDVQVLSPTNTRTMLSCDSINRVLQKELNSSPVVENTIFKVGDKAIQIKNQKAIEQTEKLGNLPTYIVNGDLCQVAQFSNNGKMFAKFFDPDRKIELPKKDNHLLLAYAITCHRFQGSEASVVIIPVHKSFGFFVNRSWLYTALSRARTLCITVGHFSAIESATQRVESSQRITRLKERLESWSL